MGSPIRRPAARRSLFPGRVSREQGLVAPRLEWGAATSVPAPAPRENAAISRHIGQRVDRFARSAVSVRVHLLRSAVPPPVVDRRAVAVSPRLEVAADESYRETTGLPRRPAYRRTRPDAIGTGGRRLAGACTRRGPSGGDRLPAQVDPRGGEELWSLQRAQLRPCLNDPWLAAGRSADREQLRIAQPADLIPVRIDPLVYVGEKLGGLL